MGTILSITAGIDNVLRAPGDAADGRRHPESGCRTPLAGYPDIGAG
jgi:hypothetical protein